MSAQLKPQLTDARDAEIAEYRALSGLAVAGLIVGLLSPVALAAPLTWIVPVAGVVLCGWALWQIRQNGPALAGRKAALLGLMLSLFFGAAAPANWLAYRWAIRREARIFAGQWFDFLAHNQPHMALQLTEHPNSRQPLNEKMLRQFYRAGSQPRKELDNYASQRLIGAIRALGRKAQVRYYRTEGQGPLGKKDVISQTYAVTFEDQQTGQKKTFFVTLNMQRHKLSTGRAEWQLMHTEEGFKPEGL